MLRTRASIHKGQEKLPDLIPGDIVHVCFRDEWFLKPWLTRKFIRWLIRPYGVPAIESRFDHTAMFIGLLDHGFPIFFEASARGRFPVHDYAVFVEGNFYCMPNVRLTVQRPAPELSRVLVFIALTQFQRGPYGWLDCLMIARRLLIARAKEVLPTCFHGLLEAIPKLKNAPGSVCSATVEEVYRLAGRRLTQKESMVVMPYDLYDALKGCTVYDWQ